MGQHKDNNSSLIKEEKPHLIPITSSSIETELHVLNSQDDSLFKYEHLRITKEKSIPQPEPLITIGTAAVASAGNITGIGAAAKAGKTATATVIAAGAISKSGNIDGFGPEFKVRPNTEGFAVINFDTEQSAADQQYNVSTVLKRAGLNETPDYYREYNIRQLPISEYQEVTDAICEGCYQKFGGIHVIIIDGGADYILSVNDEGSAKMIVQYFTHLAIKYACPVIVIVHQNPGSDKERGHFGSEIQRKCYGLLTLSREGDVSTLAPKIMRKAGNADVPLIHFRYCKEAGYHKGLESDYKEQEKERKDRTTLKGIADAVFPPTSSLKYSEAIKQIEENTGLGRESAKKKIARMAELKLIEKGSDGSYRIRN